MYSSCSPNPKGLLKWSLDFVNDPEYQNNNFGFGNNSAIYGKLLVCVRSNNYMLGIDKVSGDIKWEYQSSKQFQTTPVITTSKIFNISDNGTLLLTVLDLNGNLTYEKTFENYEGNIVENIPAVDNNKIYYVVEKVGVYGRTVISIDIDNYSLYEIFSFTYGNHSRIIYRNEILYVPYTHNNTNDQSGIIAYDLLNEEEKWKTSFGELNGISNYNPIIHNGKMYVQVQCYTKELDLETGEVLRTFIESCGNNGMSAVDNILFHPDWLDAFDLNTGELLWSQDALYTMDSGSVYHDGVFYVMFYGLVALDADNGKYLIKPNPHDGEGPSWEYDNQSGMPLLDDGVIYVNGLRGIYAFNTIGND